MNDLLQDLINRMTLNETVTDSRDSVSWHAHREAEQLRDGAVAEQIHQFVRSERNYHRRSAAYFVLGKIAKNSGSEECARVLVACAPRETNKYALATLLEGLADLPKPTSLDLSPVLTLIEDKRWLVRQAAIRTLANASPQVAEEPLLDLASRTTDDYDLAYIHATLASVGTTRSIPYLLQAVRIRKEDVAWTALGALKRIDGAAQMPLYVELLETGSHAIKWVAMEAITEHGDEVAIPVVLKRVGRILVKKRAIGQLPRSELTLGLSFLHQYRALDPRVDDFFDRVLPKKVNLLMGNEYAELVKLTGDHRYEQPT